MKKIKVKRLIIFIMGVLALTGIIMVKHNYSASAEMPQKPTFDIVVDNELPIEGLVGEDITIYGRIIAHDFVANVEPQEIVLVLDRSSSMNNSIDVYCREELIDGKCKTHGKQAGHFIERSTRIKELKRAVKEFVRAVKDVPNLKIGIVAYDGNATVLTRNINGNTGFINASDTEDLIKIIEGFKTGSGTNTGEGLRKAIYLLSDNKTGQQQEAKKTVILMSDGSPTRYSKDSRGAFYTKIDDTNPSINSDSDKSFKYSSEIIAPMIKENKYNVFTIGYGMSSSGNKRMEQIHLNMGGELPNENTPNEEKTFFADGTSGIDAIFEQIATKILNDSVKLEMNMSNEVYITSNIPSNVFQLAEEIKYNALIDKNSTSVIYEPVKREIPFTFVIRSNTVGEGIDIFTDSVIEYKWGGEKSEITFPQLKINIRDNQKLSINATLASEEFVYGENGAPIKVKYDITAEDFQHTDTSNRNLKDIVFVVDNSKLKKNEHDKIIDIKNNIYEKLLKNEELKKFSKYGVVTYSNKVNSSVDLTDDLEVINNEFKKISIHNSNATNVGVAINNAVKILNDKTTSRKDADKYIVFISRNEITCNANDVKPIEDKEYYNVINLNVGIEDEGINKSVYDFHVNKLGRPKEDYLVSVKKDGSDIGDTLLQQIADKILSSGTFKPYTRSVELKFDLNNNFTAGDGFTSVNGNEAIIKIPDVVFRHYKDGNIYKADQINQVSFTVTPKAETNGEFKFGRSNVISYKNIINTDINKQVKTPIVNIGKINHGLDLGFSDGVVLVQEENVSIASDMQFGVVAKKIISNTPSSLELRINKDIDLNDVSNIKVYKLVEGELIKVEAKVKAESQNTESFNNNQNRYTIDISEDINEKTELIIKYQCKMQINSTNELPDGTIKSKEYINTIIFGKQQQPFIIKGSQLPDLF